MEYQQGTHQATQDPSPRLTAEVLQRFIHVPLRKNGLDSALRKIHHAVLKVKRYREVSPKEDTGEGTDDMRFYESTFKELIYCIDQNPEYRVLTPCLEDLWVGYQKCTQKILLTLKEEVKAAYETLLSVKHELEYQVAAMPRVPQADSDRESTCSSVLHVSQEGPGGAVENGTFDHAMRENQEYIDSIERENEILIENFERVMGENKDLVEEKQQMEHKHREMCMKLKEVETTDASKTPRPIDSLSDISDLVGDDELARRVEDLARDLDLEKISAYLTKEEDEDAVEDDAMRLFLEALAETDKIDCESLLFSLSRRRGSTAQRFQALENQCLSLQHQKRTLSIQLASFRELEDKRNFARQRHQDELQSERKTAIQKYLGMLADKGEETWKDQLIGMGTGPDVPKLYKFGGKIRNKHMSKRDTEKLVREVWKERMSASTMQKHVSLVDFLGNHLQKKVGIAIAVVELGYNFLYSLWRYQWDADCELFLKVLTGDIREEVYIAQNNLQMDLEEMFESLDKATGQATGLIQKTDLTIALRSFFRVGNEGGKSKKRFEDIMHSLEKDQPGTHVEWAKLFEEDREYNQGDFAECIRDQFLSERVELYDAICVALYEECGDAELCTCHQVAMALVAVHPAMTEKDALFHASKLFENREEDKVPIQSILRDISEGHFDQNSSFEEYQEKAGKKQKSLAQGKPTKSFCKMPIQKRQNPLIEQALEEVRQSWVANLSAI